MRHNLKMYTSTSQIIEWLEQNQPIFAEKLCDSFGVSDLSEIDEDAFIAQICDNDRIFEMLYQEFPDYFGEITSATNACNIGVSINGVAESSDALLTTDYIESLMDDVGAELMDVGASTTYYDKIDHIYLIVYDDSQRVYEFTIPKVDLEGIADTDVNYIVDAVLSELDIG